MANKRARQQQMLEDLERQGAVLKTTRKGTMVHFPDGSSMTVHGSESDRMSEMATRARVLRAGLSWIWDGEKRRDRG